MAATLVTTESDRAAGVLVGQACGDALGVPYEFAEQPTGEPEMVGGGPGPYSPGEWSDDTQLGVCIARVAATGADLTADNALNAVAEAFLGNTARRTASDHTRRSRQHPPRGG